MTETFTIIDVFLYLFAAIGLGMSLFLTAAFFFNKAYPSWSGGAAGYEDELEYYIEQDKKEKKELFEWLSSVTEQNFELFPEDLKDHLYGKLKDGYSEHECVQKCGREIVGEDDSDN